jgi:hypothetical protein
MYKFGQNLTPPSEKKSFVFDGSFGQMEMKALKLTFSASCENLRGTNDTFTMTTFRPTILSLDA